MIFVLKTYRSRGLIGGWTGWAIVHPDFGRIEDVAGSGSGTHTPLCTTCPPKSRKLLTPLRSNNGINGKIICYE